MKKKITQEENKVVEKFEDSTLYKFGCIVGRNKERENNIDEINKAEDKLVKCYKKEKDIWTIRMAFAELRENILKGDKNE